MYKSVIISLFFYLTARSALQSSQQASSFGVELLHLIQLETNSHIVLSPFGLCSLMAGVTLGTSGRSRDQIIRAFRLPSNPDVLVQEHEKLTRNVLGKSDGVTLTSKNFIFLDESFNIKPQFQRSITSDFGAVIQNLNFQDSVYAANMANSLIESTGATASDIFQPPDFDGTSMILTNVIVFKGLWTTPFNTSDTKVESFFDENLNEVGKVNMMFMENPLNYTKMDELQARVLELPYGQDQKYSMLIVLPLDNVKVSNVLMNLAKVSFPSIFQKLQADFETYGGESVRVKLPRFKISTNVNLNKPLNDMGVIDIFTKEMARFDLISEKSIYVSSIIQKADIEVTEAGTEASAVSSAFLDDRISTPTFYVNKPFLYFVMEKSTATVLFSGIYSKPSIF